MTVTTLLISHDGARWLPAVLEGLRSQTHRSDQVVAVDTGSTDESVALVREALGVLDGDHSVVELPGTTSFPTAVAEGLAQARDSEWIWILHDDANPEPGALAALLAAAEQHPEADVLGPKLREWPSLRRLLELGVTISGTGRRETGLERAEYDQGQHDRVRRVLAVNTAGMLVRRRLLTELGGLDENLPIYGNDIDFGWRAARAGATTMVVPQAVVFHAEAAHRGLRRTELTGSHFHRREREAALYTLLANSSGGLLPLQMVRLFLGTLLRALGFLLVRAPGEAGDEIAALGSTYSRFSRISAARRERRSLSGGDPERVRSLLAPWWLPYRHGLDFVSDIAAAATNQAQDVAERRRAAKVAEQPAAVRGSAATNRTEEDELGADTGVVARFVTSPLAVLTVVAVLFLLWAARDGFSAAQLSGPGLSPVPADTTHWWGLYLHGQHPLGQGSQAPAPAYLLPLALLATVLLGSTSWAMGALLVLSAPVAMWGAWRLLRVLGHVIDPRGASGWSLLWGSLTYALVPLVSGLWGDGRFGVVATAALLPWLVHAALGFGDPSTDRRWRAAWRTGLLLALATAFAPPLWLLAVLIGAVLVGLGFALGGGAMGARSAWGPPVTALVAVPLLLLPWTLPLLLRGELGPWLLEAGRLPVVDVTPLALAAGRLPEGSAWLWTGLLLVLCAVAALVRGSTRVPVLGAWVVAALTAVLALLASLVTVGLPAADTPPSLGLFVVVLAGAAVVAVFIAVQRLWSTSHGVMVPITAALLAVVTLVPLSGSAWLLVAGEDRLVNDVETGIPEYMTQASEADPAAGVLVVTGSVEQGLDYNVRRGAGVTTGEDEILALTEPDTELTDTLQTLVERPTPRAVDRLAAQGIEYVVLLAPSDGRVASVLDATGGLEHASAEDPRTRAWTVNREASADQIEGRATWLRGVLLVLQLVMLVVVAVLCGPSRKETR